MVPPAAAAAPWAGRLSSAHWDRADAEGVLRNQRNIFRSPRLSTCSLLNADDSTPAHVVRARRALAVSVADVPLPGLVVHFDADVPQLALEQVRLIKVRGRARARARAGVLGLGLVLVLVQKVRLIKVARSLRGQPPAQELVDPVQLLGAQLIVVRLRSGVVVQLAAIELSPPRDPA
jgi:hypothetical protein